jgi:hypothetical protein
MFLPFYGPIPDEDLVHINATLKKERLHLLSELGGQTGQPVFKELRSVTDGVPKSATFIVKFPKDPKIDTNLHGQEAPVTLRFQKDGSMYHGAIVKVYVHGVLWEGEVFADTTEQRIWSVTWKLG